MDIVGSTPEGRIQARIQKRLGELGVFTFKIHGSALMAAGLPDLICCVDGQFIGLEVKTPQTLRNVSLKQSYMHDQIRKAGGKAYVVASVEDAEAAIEMIRRRAKKNGRI